ncbi:ABC transporter permease [Oscillochloris sp. ZM17-4]|uniref:ABC transporter permease n=1 Tax=Oscillochloris sp. ZM17-4 TaxID=2866714 RepID=UPI001C730949|nr:ABC transporter permease [Oscillochloris sp. ZM17-4]MBX0329753.1 ABC transporter permease [Oscillochloris sp. ZM17-4]
MRPRWHKVFRDLISSPTRTVMVVLSISIGVFAFGSILATRTIITEQLHDSYLAINPLSATITTDPFDDDLLDAVRHVPGVAQAQGVRVVSARIATGPQQWQDTALYVLPDEGWRDIGVVKPWQGAWPPPKDALLVERASLGKTKAAVGDTVRIEIAGQDSREIPIAGLTYDLSLQPAVISGQVYAYVSFDTLEWLGGPRSYNQIQIVVGEGRSDAAHIQAVADAVGRLVERSGRTVINTDVPTPPLQHPLEILLPTILFILTSLGLLSLLISGFLIINTISAILTQQTRQIGIMKAIGARADQITGLYFGLSAGFGVLALLFAVPLGVLGAYGLTQFLAGEFNLDIVGFRFPLPVLGLQVAAALIVPMATAALPIRAVARRPAREALSGETSAPPEHSPIDRLLSRLHGISRPTRLALRNTFRRRGRLVRTLIALALGGGVFITVMTLRASLFTTLDESIASQRYDVEVQFARPYRDAQAEQAVLGVPGVTGAESLLRGMAFPVLADGTTAEGLNLRAIPANTDMFAPRMAGGRWLLPGDGRAVVLTSNYLVKAPQTRVGDEITLEMNGDNERWRVVGFIEELIPPVSPAWAYVTIDAYTQALGGVGRTDTLRVATAGHDAASHAAAAMALEQRLSADGFEVRLIHTRTEDRNILAERFNVLTAVLTIMAAIIGTVGGLGLAGTMSINVLERTREIGVMRAIGASDAAVRQIVLSEGLIIGGIAWVISTVISVPMSLAMGYAFGMALLNTPLIWVYSLPAVAMWLGLVLLIASVASVLPARSASRLTVREVLAYE